MTVSSTVAAPEPKASTASTTAASPARVQKRPSTEDLPTSPKKQKIVTPKKQRVVLAQSPLMSPRKPALSLRIKKLSDKARIPTRGSALAAGYDLYSAHNTKIPSRGKALVDTDIQMMIPVDTYGRIAPRSGLASKNFIDVGAGVIDADYRGQVKILLFNHSDVDFEVKEGDRVAQLILERIYTPDVVEVDELEETVRGIGGFGSTGVSVTASA